MTHVAAVLALSLAAVGIVKSNAIREAHPAKADIAAPVDGLRVATADVAKDQTPSLVARTQAVDKTGRSVALVIGNARYPDDEAPLRQPLDDARAMADEMRARGFEVTLGENLTKQGMRDVFSGFAGKVEPGATALVFFSGYGIQSGRQTYLIPTNAEIWREEDVRRDGVALDPLLVDIEAHGAATKLVVIDASRRNPFERRFRGAAIGLAPISAPQGTLVIYSAAPGQVVHDKDTGLFAGELIAQLRRDGASVEDAFNRTRLTVARASNEQQVPGVFSSLTRDLSLPPASAAPVRHSAR
jgi:uncharacterized caspase-like protein